MSDGESLRRRLVSLREKTKGAVDLPVSGYWVGDTAGKRQTEDEWAAGRLNWRAAHHSAVTGLDALEAGDLERAELLTWMSTDHYIAALEIRVRPSDVQVLNKPAGRRGRHSKNK